LHKHTSLREHLVARAQSEHAPVFVPSSDPTLVAFAQIFADTEVYSLDVNKHLPEDEFWASYVLTAETVRTRGAQPEVIYANWSPVEPGQDLAEGFLPGPSSPLFGSTLGEAMPPEELKSALLLLVTTSFIHLSASAEQTPPLVRGAVNLPGEEFGYLVLDPGAPAPS
jgi:hypothetical protein